MQKIFVNKTKSFPMKEKLEHIFVRFPLGPMIVILFIISLHFPKKNISTATSCSTRFFVTFLIFSPSIISKGLSVQQN